MRKWSSSVEFMMSRELFEHVRRDWIVRGAHRPMPAPNAFSGKDPVLSKIHHERTNSAPSTQIRYLHLESHLHPI